MESIEDKKGTVKQRAFPFHDVIMNSLQFQLGMLLGWYSSNKKLLSLIDINNVQIMENKFDIACPTIKTEMKMSKK